MTQCPQSNVTRCITDWNICDGVPQCPGAEDELGMETSGGVSIRCDAPGAACILGRPRYPWSQYSLGVTCGQGSGGRGRGRRGRGCVQRRAWCDGTCDCDTCQDELQCDTWQCDEDKFKCHVSGICLDTSMICDGYNDCGDDDRYISKHPRSFT